MSLRATTPLVEGGILSALAIIFAFISAYLPIFGALISFIWPVPIVLLGVRHGYRYSIMATLVAGLLIALLIHPIQALSVVVGFGLIGIALGHALRNNYTPVRTLVIGSLASLLSKVAVLAIMAIVTGVNPLNFQLDALDKAVAQSIDFYRASGYSETELSNMTESMKSIIDLVKIIFPAGLALASMFDTLLNFWLAKKVLKKLGYSYPGFPIFREWYMPRWVLVLFLAGMAMLYFGKTQGNELLTHIAMNVQVASSILLLVQGLALIYFLADKYKLPKIIRGIILILILTSGLLSQIAMLVGAFDVAVDYRRLRSSRSK